MMIQAISLNTIEAINELQQLDQWVVWRYEIRDGNPTKPPHNPRTGRYASTADSATWGTYGQAMDAYECSNGRYEGIGFALQQGSGIVGGDLDGCIGKDGKISEWAIEIIRKVDTYTEISPSGTGVRFICRGSLPAALKKDLSKEITKLDGIDKDPGIEMYNSGRYLTITGNHFLGTPTTIEERSSEILEIFNQFKKAPKPATHKAMPQSPLSLSDSELINKMFSSKLGTDIQSLWYGNSGEDESRADYALMCHLAFWTGKDASRMESLFNQSALASRDKWQERADYRQRTIDAAIEATGETYSPNHSGSEPWANTTSYSPKQDHSSNGNEQKAEKSTHEQVKEALLDAIEKQNTDAVYGLAGMIVLLSAQEQASIKSLISRNIKSLPGFKISSYNDCLNEAKNTLKQKKAEERKKNTSSDDDEYSPYYASQGAMWMAVESTERNPDPDPIQISNFAAEIVTDILTDDGADKKRSYEIKAFLREKQFLFEIQAEELARGEWIDRHLGAKARITVGRQMKDHLAAAIKACSDAPEHYYYAHTGWRKIDDKMVFLHAGGGLSQVSQVSQIKIFDLTHTYLFDKSALQATSHTRENEMSQVSQVSQVEMEYRVKLNGSLSFFDLPIVEDVQKAIRSSLKFVDITRDTITMPLYAALWRSPLGVANFGVHFAGQSGLGKSELSALLQQHFGAGMHANNLPGSWESTENALEMQLFQAKDVLFFCDDFKPKGGKNDQDRLHAKADRVFRSVGNGSTRARLDSNLNQRPERRPRCLLLSTGEDVPRGESLQARVVTLLMTECITKGDASKRLSEAQRDARDGLYAQAMAGYIEWLAPRIEAIQEQLNTLVADERDNLVNEGHARLSTNIAHLIIGMKCFLQYALEMQAITLQEAQIYINRCIDALKQNATDTAIESKSKKPSEQWKEMIIAAITSKRAHLVTADGNNPGVEYGWIKRVRDVVMADGTSTTEESFSGGGDQIGWIEGDDIYLLPSLAYKAVRAMSAATGNEITTTETSLRKFLAQDGLLASTDLDKSRKTVTVRRRLQGGQKDVLHLKKEIIFPCVTLPCEKPDSLDLLDSEASRSASEAVSDVSQVFDSNGSESSKSLDSDMTQVSNEDMRAIPQEYRDLLVRYQQKVFSNRDKILVWCALDAGFKNAPFGKNEHIAYTKSLLRSGEDRKVKGAVEAMLRMLGEYDKGRISA